MHRVEESTVKYTWTSPQIQNEILTLLHHTVMRQLISNMRNNGYFAIIIDETTDLSVEEHVSICVRHVSNNFTIEESFLGFYKTEKTESATRFAIIKDALLQLGLKFDLVRAYDGAANMRVERSGLQARVLQENPKALYVYCAGHQLNLVCQNATKCLPSVVNAMEMIQSTIVFVRDSAKRVASFNKLVHEEASAAKDVHIRPLCDTGWVFAAGDGKFHCCVLAAPRLDGGNVQ